jgi:hypothetical protein
MLINLRGSTSLFLRFQTMNGLENELQETLYVGKPGYLSLYTRFDSQQRSSSLQQRPDGIPARPVSYQMHTPAAGKSIGA